MTITAVQVAGSRMAVVSEKGRAAALLEGENNQTVQAKVLQVHPPDQARLLVNGQQIRVKTRVPLHAGEEIHLKVQVSRGGYVLRLTGPSLSGGAVKPDLLLQFLSRPDTLSTLFRTGQARLTDILAKMALKSSRRDDAFLTRLIDKGGLLLETKLANVQHRLDQASATQVTDSQVQGMQRQQGALTSGQQVAKLLDNVMAEDFKGAVLKQALSPGMGTQAKSSGAGGLLQTLEKLQLLNSQSGESGRYLLPFPVLADAGFTLGQLLVDVGEGKDSGPEKKMVRVSLLLEMSRLGPVRADISILDKAVTGRFLLKNEETRAFVAAMLPVLKKQMADIDFQVLKMDCRVAAPAEIAPNTLMETLFMRNDDQVLHIVI